MRPSTRRAALRRSHTARKCADKASTALMVVMKNNETLTTAVLSVRKAGGAVAVPYFVMTLEQARINSYNVESDIGNDGAPTLTERLTLTFKSITIDHTVQSHDGASMGSSSFHGDVAPD
ncbi:MAG: type VI secretion system tube protein Hcp [Rubrivivax sp.]|nr:type VI secretion system tube protein Hcp [Rubrivivax sp.]